jgi:hypothetical protein
MRQVHSSAAFTLANILLGLPARSQSVPSTQVSANDLAGRVVTNELKFQDDHTNWMYRLRVPNKTSTPAAWLRSPQLRVLRLGLLQDGDVGIGVSPECEPTHWLRIAVLLIAFPGPARSGLHR